MAHDRKARDLKTLAFSHYSQPPDRRAARAGLYVGAVLGAPAAAVLIVILSWPGSGTGFPAVDFMDDVLWVILEWPALGWFLGYFSTVIRGRNGIEKALSLFGFGFAAALPVAIAVDDSYDWGQFIVSSSVLFTFLIVAGVVICDIMPLKQAGLRAADWVRVNNWTSSSPGRPP